MLTRKEFLTLGVGAFFTSVLTARGDNVGVAAMPEKTRLVLGCDAQQLAVLELRRYIYMRTGAHPVILSDVNHHGPIAPPVGAHPVRIVIGLKDGTTIRPFATQAGILDIVTSLEPQHYLIRTMNSKHEKTYFIAGGDPTGVLYGAYRFLELLGIRFYLHGDVLPDEKTAWPTGDLSETGRPLFSLRGIQPFHDFPEGPDWWNMDDYKAIIGQLPKLRMNFIGFHCYPSGRYGSFGRKGPEPLVWIGSPADVGSNGQVESSYPAQWANTARNGMWGYAAMNTSDFSGGSNLVFDQDVYGPRVMHDLMPNPVTTALCNTLFNRVGDMLNEAFGFARRLGVQTCVGTETPLAIPPSLYDHLRNMGINPAHKTVTQYLYRGIFTRIAQACPTDFYWLWTKEGWTWAGNSQQQFASVAADIQAAIAGLTASGNHCQFVTCGWVLGPQNNRDALNKILPQHVPMSCINRDTGYSPVDPAFADIHGRPKWAIPWLENDSRMTAPQPWVGRTRFDAADAHRYGCDGLMGIHWRTKSVAANVSALAAAGWDQSYIPAQYPPAEIDARRSMPIDDFYLDFCRANFGPDVAKPLAEILAAIDGTSMPTSTNWIKGPGGITANKILWSQVRKQWDFVKAIASQRPRIQSRGYLARFDDLMYTFQYAREVAHLGCLRGSLDTQVTAAEKISSSPARKNGFKKALAIRLELTRHWERMMEFAVSALSTRGEMGTIANLEQHTRTFLQFLSLHDVVLTRETGHSLPAQTRPALSYRGQPRLVLPTLRTAIGRDEALTLDVIIPARALFDNPKKPEGHVHWRPLGQGTFHVLALNHIARGVYRVTLPVMPELIDIFEYYVTADADDKMLIFPATAPEMNQTVVVT